MSWQLSLVSCAVILLCPRYGLNRRFSLIMNGTLICTLASLTVLHPYVPNRLLWVITLMAAGLRLFSIPVSAKSLQWLVQGTTIAIFQHQCERLYPFAKIDGIPIQFVNLVFIMLLLIAFAHSLPSVWPAWAAFYITWIIMDGIRGGIYRVSDVVDFFWVMELCLHITVMGRGVMKYVYGRKTRNIV